MKEKLFQVTIGDQTESYPPGTLFSQIAEAHQHEYDNTIVLVIVDGKLEELYKEVKKNCVLQFVTTAEQIGHKTYERSIPDFRVFYQNYIIKLSTVLSTNEIIL